MYKCTRNNNFIRKFKILSSQNVWFPPPPPLTEAQFIPNKQLQPKETQIYIKLVKYAMQALDIYQVQPNKNWLYCRGDGVS